MQKILWKQLQIKSHLLPKGKHWLKQTLATGFFIVQIFKGLCFSSSAEIGVEKNTDKLMTWNNLSKANETSFHKTIVDSNLKAMLFSSIFGSIAVLSFLGNLLLCLAICRRRKRLSKPYNILMINRAAMDMLIGLNFFQTNLVRF